MAPRLGGSPDRLARLEVEPARAETSRNPLRHLYGTAAWRRLSWEVRLAAAFTCARCGAVEGRKGQTVADHRIPHCGNLALFWDRTNLQCLCKPCHDAAKQAEEAADRTAARLLPGGGGV